MGQFFGFPAMLWWTAAAAVPIIIHLLSRRRYKRVSWAAMDFLLRAFKKTRKRLRIENLLLLLLRVAALLLLAFALADPRLGPTAIFGGTKDSSRNVMLIVDTSFSMDARDASDTSRFARAQRYARRVLSELDSESDAAALITAGSPAHLAMPLAADVARVQAAVDALNATEGGTDLLGALKIAAGLLAAPDVAREYPGAKSIYVLTDMQKTSLTAPQSADARETSTAGTDAVLERLLRDLKEHGGQVTFVDVAVAEESRFPNVAVVDVRHVGKALVRGQRLTFEARVRNFGDQSVSGDLQFMVNNEDSFVQMERITGLKGRATGTEAECEYSHLFSHDFPAAGWHHLAVRWVDDALKVDNIRRYAFYVRDWIRVLAVAGSDHREPADSSTFFVSRALNPATGTAAAVSSMFRVTEIGASEFGAVDLKDFDLVIFADVAGVSPSRLVELERFVDAGGALFWFPGKSIEARDRIGDGGSVNTLFHKQGQGLLPGKLLRIAGSDDRESTPWFVSFERLDHPGVSYFADPKIQPALTRIPVNKFVEVAVDERPDVNVLVSFRQDVGENVKTTAHPAIIEKPHGKGTVVMFTSSADTTWNLLGTTPAYVPLIRELAFATVRARERRNILVGEAVVERFDSSVTNVFVQRGKDGEVERTTSPSPDGSSAELAFSKLDQAGVLTLRIPESNATAREREKSMTRKLAVNIDTAESDLERIDPNWLTSVFGTDLFQLTTDRDAPETRAAAGGESTLWRTLLYILLAGLGIETILAARFSRTERGEPAA